MQAFLEYKGPLDTSNVNFYARCDSITLLKTKHPFTGRKQLSWRRLIQYFHLIWSF